MEQGKNEDRDLAEARFFAEHQYSLAREGLHEFLKRVRASITQYPEVDAWALLVQDVCRQLDCHTKRQGFAVEMMVTAAIDLIKKERDEKAAPGRVKSE